MLNIYGNRNYSAPKRQALQACEKRGRIPIVIRASRTWATGWSSQHKTEFARDACRLAEDLRQSHGEIISAARDRVAGSVGIITKSPAGVVKLVYTADLKSAGLNRPYGFKSRSRHHPQRRRRCRYDLICARQLIHFAYCGAGPAGAAIRFAIFGFLLKNRAAQGKRLCGAGIGYLLKAYPQTCSIFLWAVCKASATLAGKPAICLESSRVLRYIEACG